jgi:hypothetical protein
MIFSGAVHGPYKDKLGTALPIMSSVAPADGNTSIAQKAKIVLKVANPPCSCPKTIG